MEIAAIRFYARHCRITLRFPHYLYSSQLPELAPALLTMLPSLREHRCTNRAGRPFVEELPDTELGHVFEHVVLEILRRRGLAARGQTTWNWTRDPIGTYQVTISSGKRLLVKESVLIAQAIITNALLGPPIRFSLPGPEPISGTLPLAAAAGGTLFALEAGVERRRHARAVA